MSSQRAAAGTSSPTISTATPGAATAPTASKPPPHRRPHHPRDLPAADPADYVAGRRTDWATPEYHVDVTIEAPHGRIAGRLGEEPNTLHADSDTRCRLTATRDDDPAWLATQLTTLGVPFHVHNSPELAASLRTLVHRLTAALPTG